MRHRGFMLLVFAQVKLSITSGICDTEALIDIFKNEIASNQHNIIPSESGSQKLLLGCFCY